MGGYPGGYLAVAAEEGITDDVNVVSNLSDCGATIMVTTHSSADGSGKLMDSIPSMKLMRTKSS